MARGDIWQNNDLVFPTSVGTPLDAARLVRTATLLLAAGEHPKVVQELLGHASVQLTLDTYSHVAPALQKQAAARMDAILTAAPDEARHG